MYSPDTALLVLMNLSPWTINFSVSCEGRLASNRVIRRRMEMK